MSTEIADGRLAGRVAPSPEALERCGLVRVGPQSRFYRKAHRIIIFKVGEVVYTHVGLRKGEGGGASP